MSNIAMNGIALHKNNLFNGLPVAQSLTGFLRGFFMDEVWKTIPRCEGYEASNFGRVKNNKTGNIYKGYKRIDGYFSVSIKEDGRNVVRTTSQLVARAFLGESNGRFVLHNDGNASNNVLSNLRYGTAKDNYDDSINHGTNSKGEKNGASKLSLNDVVEIINKREKNGTEYSDLAKEYGVTKQCIYLIIKGTNWKHARAEQKGGV